MMNALNWENKNGKDLSWAAPKLTVLGQFVFQHIESHSLIPLMCINKAQAKFTRQTGAQRLSGVGSSL